MKKILLLLIAFVAFSMNVSAARCHRCNGSGRITIGARSSNYGLSNSSDKVKCPICQNYYFPGEHTETCPDCGGNGQSGSSNRAEQSRNDKSAELDQYLTPEEYSLVQSLLKSLKDQPYYPKCEMCNGTGTCTRCGGVISYDESRCIQCDGSGMCPTCRGQGTGPVQYRAPENKDQIVAQIKEIYDNARKRMNKESSDESSSDLSFNGNTSSSDASTDSDNSWIIWSVLGVGILGVVIVKNIL